MKVLLVNPPQPGLVDPHTYPPVGLAYIHAAVERWRPDVHCRLLNLAGATVEGATSTILEHAPNVVGYTATTTYWDETVQLAESVYFRCPDVVQVVGGAHPTVTGQTSPVFASTFIGPGEKAFIRFLDDLDAGRRPQRQYMTEPLDWAARPMPDPAEVLGGRLHAATHERTAVVFSSFGCTGNCAFCAAQAMYRKVEQRPIDSVVAELERLLRHGIRDVRFMDDTFGNDPERVKALCAALTPLDMRWGCVIRVDQVTPEILEVMHAAGCVEVGYGCESFDQLVLDALRKRTTVRQNIGAVEMAHEAGLGVHIFLMISTPGETAPRTVRMNIAALEQLQNKFSRLLLSTLMPYPGSPIYRDPARFGALIIEPDATRFNQHQYQGREAHEAEVWSPLIFNTMSREQQLENIRLMRDYAGKLKQVNHGRFGVQREHDSDKPSPVIPPLCGKGS